MQETWVRLLGGEDALQKETATHPSILAGKSHGQEPGRLSHGLSKFRHSLATRQQQSDYKIVGLKTALNNFFNKAIF